MFWPLTGVVVSAVPVVPINQTSKETRGISNDCTHISTHHQSTRICNNFRSQSNPASGYCQVVQLEVPSKPDGILARSFNLWVNLSFELVCMLRPHQLLLVYFWWTRRRLVSSHPRVKGHDFSARRRVDEVRRRQHCGRPERISHDLSQELRRQPTGARCPVPPDAGCDGEHEAWIRIVCEDRQSEFYQWSHRTDV